MSRPDGVTGCESDKISQKMCLGDAVGASDLQMLDNLIIFLIRFKPYCFGNIRLTSISLEVFAGELEGIQKQTILF